MNVKATAILPILARLQGRTRMDNHPNKTARQHNKAAHLHEGWDTSTDAAIDSIVTIPNLISLIRLCMAPLFLIFLFGGNDILAAVVFAIASGTDFLDGQIARRTGTVSKLGQILDPAVDRVLMACAVLGLFLVGRLPLWLIIIVIVRDFGLVIAGAILLQHWHKRIPVIYPGKIATTLLFVGFAGLLLNAPLVPGLALVALDALPGFSTAACSWGIWFVYAGLILGLLTALYYIVAGIKSISHCMKDTTNS